MLFLKLFPISAYPEHAHSGPGDVVWDLQQEGEEQVVSQAPPRHTPWCTTKKINHLDAVLYRKMQYSEVQYCNIDTLVQYIIVH